MVRSTESFVDYLSALVRSGHQLLQVTTVEERRCLEDLSRACLDTLPEKPSDAPWRLVTWDFVRGFSDAKNDDESFAGDPAGALLAIPTKRFDLPEVPPGTPCPRVGMVTALSFQDGVWSVVVDDDQENPIGLPIGSGPSVRVGQQVRLGHKLSIGYSPNVLFVFLDPKVYIDDDQGFRVRRALRNLVEEQRLSDGKAMRSVVLLGAVPVRHQELSACTVQVPYALPDVEALCRAIDYVAKGVPDGKGEMSREFRYSLAEAMRGFGDSEATDTTAFLAYTYTGFVHPDDEQPVIEQAILRDVARRQRDAWRNEEVLELEDLGSIDDFGAIGGFANYKRWIRGVGLAMSERAKELRVPTPRGAVLGGVAGSGKSLIARITAKELRVPLVTFKIERVFDSLVGASEGRMEAALEKVAAKGRCVLLLDELDKSMGGVAEGAGGDSGVSMRVLGKLLSWLAEPRRQDTFVLATLNRVRGLPPELLRAGRFDVVWYVGLPSDDERSEILDIHLRKHGLDPGMLSQGGRLALVEATHGWVGAEIEQLVKEAVLEEFIRTNGESARPGYEVLAEVARRITPNVQLDRDGVEAIQAAFEGKARPVSGPTGESSSKAVSKQRAVRLGPNKGQTPTN